MIDHSSHSTTKLLQGLWSHLSGQRRIQLCMLLIMMLFSAAAELISLGAVIPFLGVMTDPNTGLQRTLFPLWISRHFALSENFQLLIVVIVFALAIVFAATIRLVNLWLNGRMAATIGSDLSCESYLRTLYQPCSVHIHGIVQL